MPSTPQAPSRTLRAPWALRWTRRLAWALAALLALWGLAWLALPPLLRGVIERQAGEALGRAVSLQAVEVRPWAMAVTLRGLQVRSADGQSVQFELGRLEADAELESLLRLAPVVGELRIESPRLRLAALGEGRYDIDDILARLNPPAPGEARPLRFSVFNIAVTGGELDFTDGPRQRTHTVRALQLGLPFLSNIGARREVFTQAHLAFTLNGEPFKLDGTTRPFAADRRSELTIDVPRLLLQAYTAYWPAGLPLQPQAGELSLKATVAFEQREAPQVTVSGSLGLRDLRIARGAQPMLAVEAIQLRVDRAGWPATAPFVFDGDAQVAGGHLQWKGQASATAAEVNAQVEGLPLSAASAWLADVVRLPVAGTLTGDAQVAWQAGGALRVKAGALRLADAALGPAKTPQAGWTLLALEGVEVDLGTRQASAQSLTLDQPRLVLQRRADGRWAAQDWLVGDGTAARKDPPKPAAAPGTSSAAAKASTPSAAPTAWQVELAQLRVAGGRVAYEDLAAPEPVRLDLSALQLQAGPLRPMAAAQAPIQLNASLRVGQGGARARRSDEGQLSYAGTVTLPSTRPTRPLEARGQVQARHLPVHALEPYLRGSLNLDLLRADLGYTGRVEVALPAAGPDLRLAGNVAVDDLRARTLTPGEDLLDWKSLNLRGVQLQVQAGALRRLAVEETVLNDFFARVIIGADGRINLQDLARAPQAAATPAATAAPATTPAPASATATVAAAPPAAPASVPAPAPTGATARAAAPDIRFGPIALVNGRVYYSDRFIQPNYSANLSEVTGRLAAFDNRATAPDGSPAMADLSLRGRAEGTASLEVEGRLNPLAQPLALDLKGRVRDLELPPLSPYSGKYAGYGIERGKLSLDVAYRITPDGQLTASNQVILNQLVFGDHIEGSAANLPVKLAVALLADRQGVIDINLPVSGSINDPQFRLGPVIVRVIVNLIGKALTAPFALLANAFGGGPENSDVAFAPGRAELDAASRERLEKVARALADRPALRLTVVGHSDPQAEQAAWRRARLDEMVRAEKRRQASRAGTAAADLAAVQVAPAEYPALLKEVYRRADITKPRNLVGIARDLPQEQMESLLMASIAVTPEAMRELALARSVAVRDFLAARSVPAERLFLGAPVVQAEEKAPAPRAALTLGVK